VKRILYTRHDGGVNICTPAPDILAWLSNGGYWDGKGVDLEEQVERAVIAGHSRSAAIRFVRALDHGGHTTAEAYDIIRDRDCGHLGTAFDLVAFSDLPDRWFRDAWRRGHNGGPIEVDMPAARSIHFGRITRSIDQERTRRRHELSMWQNPVEVNLGALADKIEKAECTAALKAIWWE